MKIVIDISENQYEIAKEFIKTVDDKSPLANAIVNGIPLPKEHGRLIDADAVCKNIISALGIRDENYLLEAEKAVYKRIKNAPTIIEADNVESEDNK